MKYNKAAGLLQAAQINSIPDPALASHHFSLGCRYLHGDGLARSKMMAAAHLTVAVTHGSFNLQAQARRLAATLSNQQAKTAALLATLFIAQARRDK